MGAAVIVIGIFLFGIGCGAFGFVMGYTRGELLTYRRINNARRIRR
jgi:hypothetical protein